MLTTSILQIFPNGLWDVWQVKHHIYMPMICCDQGDRMTILLPGHTTTLVATLCCIDQDSTVHTTCTSTLLYWLPFPYHYCPTDTHVSCTVIVKLRGAINFRCALDMLDLAAIGGRHLLEALRKFFSLAESQYSSTSIGKKKIYW